MAFPNRLARYTVTNNDGLAKASISIDRPVEAVPGTYIVLSLYSRGAASVICSAVPDFTFSRKIFDNWGVSQYDGTYVSIYGILVEAETPATFSYALSSNPVTSTVNDNDEYLVLEVYENVDPILQVNQKTSTVFTNANGSPLTLEFKTAGVDSKVIFVAGLSTTTYNSAGAAPPAGSTMVYSGITTGGSSNAVLYAAAEMNVADITVIPAKNWTTLTTAGGNNSPRTVMYELIGTGGSVKPILLRNKTETITSTATSITVDCRDTKLLVISATRGGAGSGAWGDTGFPNTFYHNGVGLTELTSSDLYNNRVGLWVLNNPPQEVITLVVHQQGVSTYNMSVLSECWINTNSTTPYKNVFRTSADQLSFSQGFTGVLSNEVPLMYFISPVSTWSTALFTTTNVEILHKEAARIHSYTTVPDGDFTATLAANGTVRPLSIEGLTLIGQNSAAIDGFNLDDPEPSNQNKVFYSQLNSIDTTDLDSLTAISFTANGITINASDINAPSGDGTFELPAFSDGMTIIPPGTLVDVEVTDGDLILEGSVVLDLPEDWSEIQFNDVIVNDPTYLAHEFNLTNDHFVIWDASTGLTINPNSSKMLEAGVAVPFSTSIYVYSVTGNVLTDYVLSRHDIVIDEDPTEDEVPDAFDLVIATGGSPTNCNLSVQFESQPITVAGVTADIDIAITATNLEYAIDPDGGGYDAWTSSPGTVQLGYLVKVRFTSSGSYSTDTTHTLNIGGVTDFITTSTRAPDTVASDFTLVLVDDVINPNAVVANTVYEMDPVTVGGLDTGITVGLTVTNMEYSLDPDGGGYGPWVTTPVSVNNGDLIRTRLLSSNTPGGQVTGTLNVGSVSDSITLTTATPDDETPDTFDLVVASGQNPNTLNPNTLYYSSDITVAGLGSGVDVAMSQTGGLSFSVRVGGNFDTWGTTPVNVQNGDVIRCRFTSGTYEATATYTLTIGTVTDTLNTTVRVEDEIPNGFVFNDSNVAPSTLVESNTQTVSGLDTGTLTTVAVTNGEISYYRASTWSSWASSANVQNADIVKLRTTSLPNGVKTVTLSAGGTDYTWDVISQFSYVTDLLLSSNQQILALINHDNPDANLTLSDVTFGTPALHLGPEPGNTSLVVNSAVNSGFVGNVTVFYDRLNLAEYANRDTPELIVSASPTWDEIITAFNSYYACNLGPNDFDNTITIPAPDEDGEVVVVTAKPGSLVYYGSVNISLFANGINIDTIIINTNLGGLAFPPV